MKPVLFLHKAAPRRGKTHGALLHIKESGKPALFIAAGVGMDSDVSPAKAAEGIAQSIGGITLINSHGHAKCPAMVEDPPPGRGAIIQREHHKRICGKKQLGLTEGRPILLEDYARLHGEGVCPVFESEWRAARLKRGEVLLTTPQKARKMARILPSEAAKDCIIIADEVHSLNSYLRQSHALIPADLGACAWPADVMLLRNYVETMEEHAHQWLSEELKTMRIAYQTVDHICRKAKMTGPRMMKVGDDIACVEMPTHSFEKIRRSVLANADRRGQQHVIDYLNDRFRLFGEWHGRLPRFLPAQRPPLRPDPLGSAMGRLRMMKALLETEMAALGPRPFHAALANIEERFFGGIGGREAVLKEEMNSLRGWLLSGPDESEWMGLADFMCSAIETAAVVIPTTEEGGRVLLTATDGRFDVNGFHPTFTAIRNLAERGAEVHALSATPPPMQKLERMGFDVVEREWPTLRPAPHLLIVLEGRFRSAMASKGAIEGARLERLSGAIADLTGTPTIVFARNKQEGKKYGRALAGRGLIEQVHHCRGSASQSVDLRGHQIMLLGIPFPDYSGHAPYFHGEGFGFGGEGGGHIPHVGHLQIAEWDAAAQLLQATYRGGESGKPSSAILLGGGKRGERVLQFCRDEWGHDIEVIRVPTVGQKGDVLRRAWRLLEAAGGPVNVRPLLQLAADAIEAHEKDPGEGVGVKILARAMVSQEVTRDLARQILDCLHEDGWLERGVRGRLRLSPAGREALSSGPTELLETE